MIKSDLSFSINEVQTGLPVVLNAAKMKDLNIDDLTEMFIKNRFSIEDSLNKSGGVHISGLKQIKDAKDFEKIVSSLDLNLRDYVGGTSPRHIVRGNIMTATEVPAEYSIPLHQEMAYTKTPPGRIIFFSEKPATLGGGYSTVGDMRLALKKINPSIRRKFERFGIQLRRTLPSPENLKFKPGIQKTWSDVFGVKEKSQVEEIVFQKGWRAEWLSDDSLHLWQDILPAVRSHPVTGEEIWCNQAHFFSPACMMLWAKEDNRLLDYQAIAKARISNPEMLDNVFFGNGSPVPEEEALHIYRVLRLIERPIQLRKSDILILDNLILAHGRTAFIGERSILVALADKKF